ncbi:MAG: hypothetical protein AABN34_22960 [Acidobacteriota bacterium]
MGLGDRLRKVARVFMKLPSDRANARQDPKPGSDERRLWKWLGLLAFVVGIFGFGTDLLNLGLSWLFNTIFESNLNLHIEHAEGWELGAITWSVGFTLWFYWKFQLVEKSPATNKKIILLLLWAIPSAALLAVVTIWWPPDSSYSLHVFFVLVISSIFALVDRILSKHHKGMREKLLFEQSFWLADVPALVAFAILAVYQIFQFYQKAPEDLRLFMSGAVSFQLIASTVIFALVHLRMIPSLRSRNASSKSAGKTKRGNLRNLRQEELKRAQRHP